MVTCPECDRELKYLNAYSREEARYTMKLNINGEPEFHFDRFTDTDQYIWIDFECPYCMYTIAVNDNEATNFLKGD